MRKFLLALLLSAPFAVFAQAPPQAVLTVNWTAPTTDDVGAPLTGVLALTRYEVYVSTSVVPDNAAVPTATVNASLTTIVQQVQAHIGDTLHIRMKACNAKECSVFTSEATKVVPGTGVPSVPTNVTIDIQITR